MIPPVLLKVGGSVESGEVHPYGDVEVMLKIRTLSSFPDSLIRVQVDGKLSIGRRSLATFVLIGTDSVIYTVSSSSRAVLVRGECLNGEAIFSIERGDHPTPPLVPVAGNWVLNDIPSGLVNGSNTTFNLAFAPTPPGSLLLFRNGLLLTQSKDYLLSGCVVEFYSPPRVDCNIVASYTR